MSKYTSKFKYEYDFEDDTVKVSSTRLKRKDFLKLTPFIETDDKGEVRMTFHDQNKFVDICADLLPKYIVSMTGLNDEDGVPITLETVIEETYFMDITSEMINRLFSSANMSSKKERKNLDGQSPPDSTEQPATDTP